MRALAVRYVAAALGRELASVRATVAEARAAAAERRAHELSLELAEARADTAIVRGCWAHAEDEVERLTEDLEVARAEAKRGPKIVSTHGGPMTGQVILVGATIDKLTREAAAARAWAARWKRLARRLRAERTRRVALEYRQLAGWRRAGRDR